MSYLALDIGKKRIGIATSESGIISNEYKTINNDENSINSIIEIIKAKSIKKLIVGYPINMDGTQSDFAKYVKKYINKLLENIKIEVEFIDERLTTQEAYRQLRQMGLNKKEIEKRIDQYSAKIILEDYLL